MNFSETADVDERGLDINITPLIDIVFLLLIFFMVSTSFDDINRIDVDLPKASATNNKTESKSITISIQKDGAIYIDKQQLSLTELESRLRELNKSSLVIVRADEGSLHGNVVEVMDRARSVGLTKLAIAADEN